MSEKFEVICVGSALLDVYLKSDKFVKVASGEVVGGVALCEEFGGKTEVQEVEVASGGAGTNNAVSMARKGFKTGLVAEMGTDLIAATILEEMKRERVDTSMVRQEPDEETGIASIMVSPDGGRSVAVYRGASRMLTKSDFDWERLFPEWLYISSLGGEMVLLEGLIGHARHYGIKVAVNPGNEEITQIGNWGGLGLFEGVEVVLVNREEAAGLMGVDVEDERWWRCEEGVFGPKRLVVTDGRDGGKVWAEGAWHWFEALVGETVEETGAGDAFGSGLVAGLMKGVDLGMAVEWGKRQAASVVKFMGAKRGLLGLEEISRRF